VSRKRYLVIAVVVVAAVALSTLIYTVLANHRPVISRLLADSAWTTPSGSLQVTCTASDPDGDEMSYAWSTTGGVVAGEGASVTWIAPERAGYYYVTVNVTDGRGPEVTGYVEVRATDNTSPSIDSLTADAEWTTPAGGLQVTCTASDPDGEALNYEWAATGGDISGAGAVVSWIAPQAIGIYNVAVVVRDGHGGEDTALLSLSVASSSPPTIEKLAVTAKEPKYLKTTSLGYTVGRAKQYDIACDVSDTSGGLLYNWSCESGVISGDGPTITWTAPDESLERTMVTVIVADAYGSMATESVIFTVASCTPCTFG
jgi:hypothetical protein